MASIRRKGKAWVVEVFVTRDEDGRQRKISRSAPTKREAVAIGRELEGQVSASGRRLQPNRTLNDLLDAHLAAPTWTSEATGYGYARLIKADIRPALGSIKLSELRPDRLEAFYRSMRARGLSNSSVRNVHRVLSHALSRAVRWGWLSANPALHASPGPTGAGQGNVASQSEVEKLLAAADPDLRLAVRLAAVTGARRSELVALRWDDVDFDAGTLRIERAIVQAGGKNYAKGTKTGATRVIPLDAGTMALLREHRGIGSILNASPTTLSRRLTALCGAVGVEVGWHSLRHYCATSLLASADIKTISKRLGHSDARTTLAIYSHSVAERDRAAGDELGRLLG